MYTQINKLSKWELEQTNQKNKHTQIPLNANLNVPTAATAAAAVALN